MMISDLPEDLVEEILSKIPVAALIRIRSTCKKWNALLNNRKFIQKHFSKAPKQNMVVVSKDSRVYSLPDNLHGLSNNFADPTIMVSGKHSLIDSRDNSVVDIHIICYYCDGLLLCTTNKEPGFVVWNPCTGQTKWIKPKNENYHKPDQELYHKYIFGYEDNSFSRNYKIARICLCGHIYKLEICDFDSNSWRVFDVTSESVLWSSCGVSLKGNFYCIGQNAVQKWVIISFDFTTEEFGCLCLPDGNGYEHKDLSSVREEQLSVLYYNLDPIQIEIWMTNEIKPNFVSWSKFFTTTMIHLYDSRKFSCDMNFLIDKEKKIVLFRAKMAKDGIAKDILYIVGEDEYKEKDLGQSSTSDWPIMFTYVPSLVQI